MTRLYENVIANLKTTEGWSEEIKCNIKVKQGCLLYPALFGIYMDKLEECLEVVGYDGPKLTGPTIILLIYVDDIILLAKSHDDLYKRLRILQDYCFEDGYDY